MGVTPKNLKENKTKYVVILFFLSLNLRCWVLSFVLRFVRLIKNVIGGVDGIIY